MGYENSYLTVADGTKLAIHHWSISEPKATVLVIHGYAEHGFRYDHFAKHLNGQGIEVYAYDQRSHGKSDGLMAYIDRFDQFLDDTSDVITHIGKSVFLFAHSMGGLVGVRYCALRDDDRVDGLITSGAALALGTPMTIAQKIMAPILNVLAPKLQLQKLDTSTLTRSSEIYDKYFSDPLVYTEGIRVRSGLQMVGATADVQSRMKDVKCPLLVMHGTADGLCTPNGSEKLYREASTTDKELILLDGYYHELVNEPERVTVYGHVVKWISARC